MLLLVDQKGIQRHLRPQAETAHKAIQIAPGVQLSPGIRVLLKQAELRLLELLAQRLLQLAHGVFCTCFMPLGWMLSRLWGSMLP